jgi:hypothetical protein
VQRRGQTDKAQACRPTQSAQRRAERQLVLNPIDLPFNFIDRTADQTVLLHHPEKWMPVF